MLPTRAEQEFNHWHRNATQPDPHKDFERESYLAGFKRALELVREIHSTFHSQLIQEDEIRKLDE